MKKITIVLLLLTLTSCGQSYTEVGKIAPWIKVFLKGVTVVVHDSQKNINHVAGTFMLDVNNTEQIWGTCKQIAERYVQSHPLNDWEYGCCGKTFWSDCVKI